MEIPTHPCVIFLKIKGPFSHKHHEFKVSSFIKETKSLKKYSIDDLKSFGFLNFREPSTCRQLVGEKGPKSFEQIWSIFEQLQKHYQLDNHQFFTIICLENARNWALKRCEFASKMQNNFLNDFGPLPPTSCRQVETSLKFSKPKLFKSSIEYFFSDFVSLMKLFLDACEKMDL